jgi:hypothetical protein
MFRAALATAGAHEAAPHKAMQAVLHSSYSEVVVPR